MIVRDADALWNISQRSSTKAKLAILRKCFSMWITVWNKQDWSANEWYVIDLFAGRGKYEDGENSVSGSPLVFLETIAIKASKLKQNVKIKLFFVEENKENFKHLQKNVDEFIKKHLQLQELTEIQCINADCNKVIKNITAQISNSSKCPLFVLIDPYGLQIKKTTTEEIIGLKNTKDIMFNYILEGVRRTSGIAKKAYYGGVLNRKEIKTLETLIEFIGENISVIKSDIKILQDFVHSLFTSRQLNVVAYDIKYPKREDILYYLLFASKNLNITKIVEDIFAKQKEDSNGPTLFGGKEYYKKGILTVKPRTDTVTRKTLLYKTKVEYGSWTINHVVGCMHGCNFPCYAFMMARKFGWVENYEDWRKPRLVENALEILEKEISKYKNEIDFVHLSFMSDPFMYDIKHKNLIPTIKKLTLEIIEKLNNAGIKVTTLTKGFYPDEIVNGKFSKNNEYGITLVSLNDVFKKEYEPFSAPYELRLKSLRAIHNAGLKTWVSIEPYPTPNLDEEAENIEQLLARICFVNKVIFGKLNYNISSSNFLRSENFYKRMAEKVVKFCEDNKIEYHIKLGTPLSRNATKGILRV